MVWDHYGSDGGSVANLSGLHFQGSRLSSYLHLFKGIRYLGGNRIRLENAVEWSPSAHPEQRSRKGSLTR